MLAKLMSLLLLGLIRLLTGAQARWYGCPPKAEQRIYFANHQSHADLVMIWAALPEELRSITRPIAARDYWTKTPFKQWITTALFNAIYIDRDRSGAQDPLQPLIGALRSGDSMILFPEGTRGSAEEPQAFRAGLYNLAQQFPQVVLVPAWINNAQRAMPKGEVVQALAMAFIACVAGSLGHLVMKALKRDRGITNWGAQGQSLTGASGLRHRVDALCFAAPVFFPSVRWYFGL